MQRLKHGMQKSDQSAVQAVLAGDKEAYGALVRAHSAPVFRVAYRIVGNAADAEEIVQEAFLRGYQRLESFQQRSSFGTWIYRIAVHCALNRVRRSGTQAQCQRGDEDDREGEPLQVAAQGVDPERSLRSHQIQAALQAAMRRLTPMERTAFVLRHHEDRPISEIAAVLGIAPNAAKQAVFRAVQKLRQVLAPLRESV
jgi:RNA polymerase sigma-70 factor (ECF subfamily)